MGNPDLVAPHPGGLFREPGLYAHAFQDDDLATPQFCGKPFDNTFVLVRETFEGFDPDRIAVIGDTLHTHILGAAQAGRSARQRAPSADNTASARSDCLLLPSMWGRDGEPVSSSPSSNILIFTGSAFSIRR